jgi:cytochrome P450
VERLRPRIGELAEELLAPLRDAGRFDVINDFAFPLPVTVICELLGVPAEDRDLFRLQTRDLAVILDWDITPEQFGGAAGAAMNFAAYLVPLFEERRRAPQGDLVSALVAAEEAGDRLGADELLTTVVLLLTAGHETTMNLIGNGLLALLRNPDQLALLRSRPDLMPAAVEELLRYDSPVRLTVRTALADNMVLGERVQAGEQVMAMLDTANHDPTVFESPDVLDVTRDARHHLAFGGGAHYCLGAALARAEAQLALSALIALPELELTVDEPEWRPLTTFHALQSLPVACRP